MASITKLLRQGRNEELWQMCCGYIDLSMKQFMVIQRRLLLDQLELLRNCELGRKVMRGAMPTSLEEFRRTVPLTTYSDYCPELLEQREDVLPSKSAHWLHTSGKSGEYPYKWVPYSEKFAHELAILMYGTGIFASCNGRGDVSKAKEHAKIVYAVAPAPYASGVFVQIMQQEVGAAYLPPLDKAQNMSFEQRTREGFRLALSRGFDYFFGLSTVLIVVGEQFSARSRGLTVMPLLSQPAALFRLLRGLVKSRMERRPMLPRDLWSVNGIMSGGADSTVLRERLRYLWGRYPLETYACAEGSLIASQTWDYGGLTFIPNLNFLEFIPEDEHLKWRLDNSYIPKTILIDELAVDKNYEIVLTNFHGGAMVRYRIGDMVKITALRNNKLGIDIPQMIFERRADDLIDIAGFTRLTERVVWQAIESSGIPYQDWTVRKEIIKERPVLHVYLEVKDGCAASNKRVASKLHKQLKKLDKDYADLESILGVRPIQVSLLPQGAFQAYMSARQAEGADLAHIKPPHINPSDDTLSLLGVKTGCVST
ncbi:MAG: GH3 auxin-responsive promoter family protein [Dehalococcoidia bacterium]